MKRKTSSFIPRILLLAGVISLPFFLTGCEGNSDEEDDLDYASLTNQQAQTENQQSTQSSSQPSQAPTKTQFVAEGVADARGTWYKHGSTGGWYGPNKEWGFGWFYIEQYGDQLEGKFEDELYQQGFSYNYLPTLKGSVTSSQVHFDYLKWPGTTNFFTLDEDIIGNNIGIKVERTSTSIERRKTPW